MIKCSKCPQDAVTFIRYSGAHLCKEHFNEFFIRRVKKEVRQQGTMPKGSKLALAVSGGKDSMSMMSVLSGIFSERQDISLEVLFVSEGIDGFREECRTRVESFAKKLDIPYNNVKFKDLFDITTDEIAAQADDRSPCTYCGVLRRTALNRAARDMGATKLSTGHNLDDVAQSILMNVTRGDMERLARMGPHKKVQEGFVPRLLPLRQIPEEETRLYAMLNEIPFVKSKCPHNCRAHRGLFRDVLDQLEDRTPGTRHATLKGYLEISDKLLEMYPPSNLAKCANCGEPTTPGTPECQVCRLLKNLKV